MAEDEERGEEQEDDGLSTPQKVMAGAALGVAVPAAVGVARKLLGGGGDEDDDEGASSEPTARERRSSARPKAKPRAKSKTKPRASSSSSSSSASMRAKPKRTREQLYRQATRLKIDGRSSMNKAQLERAVERAKSK